MYLGPRFRPQGAPPAVFGLQLQRQGKDLDVGGGETAEVARLLGELGYCGHKRLS